MEKDKHQYVEDFGLFAEKHIGINATMGRILGWLLICDPPQQTLDDISDALDMSKSTISTTVRAMTQFGMIERVSIRGDRRHFYQLKDDLWQRAFEQAMQQFAGFTNMAERGLKLLQDDELEQRRRLEDMQRLYSFLQQEFPAMLTKWQQKAENETAKMNTKYPKGNQEP